MINWGIWLLEVSERFHPDYLAKCWALAERDAGLSAKWIARAAQSPS